MLSATCATLRVVGVVAAVLLAASVPGRPAGAARGYQPAELACGFADPEVRESSGVASASWSDDVIWTHNDSGDSPRFFAVDTSTCATVSVHEVTGAGARDWEDMTRAGTTLYIGDIGDNPRSRDSVAVYEVPEPGPGAPSGQVSATTTRVLRYPDGAHDAESLFVDPITGRLVIVSKSGAGLGAAYRAPASGSGVMEKVADLHTPAGAQRATGADATEDRIIVRTYNAAYEFLVQPGDSLAATLARPPDLVTLPVAPQGEAIAYTTGGAGVWVTSESEGGPVHRLAPAPEPPAGDQTGEEETEVPAVVLVLAVLAVAALVIGGVMVMRHRRQRLSG